MFGYSLFGVSRVEHSVHNCALNKMRRCDERKMKGEEERKVMEESLIQIQLNKKNKPPSKLKEIGDIFPSANS